MAARQARRLLGTLQPDIVHAHYASGYGTLARLTGWPYVLSVWGSDVYTFPLRGRFCHHVVDVNLRGAVAVCSTSVDMARQVRLVCPELDRIDVIPFGVDADLFCDDRNHDPRTEVVVGAVKALRPVYAIDVLIKAFALAQRRMYERDPSVASRLRLRIVGEGAEEASLKRLAQAVALPKTVEFVGAVPHARVPEQLNRLDIFANLSRAESFGVAVLEAAAVGLPVIATSVGGLPEVVVDGETGLVVPPDDVEAAAGAIARLACDRVLRSRLGQRGRDMVLRDYSWAASLDAMELVYERTKSATAAMGAASRRKALPFGAKNTKGGSKE
jgi:glycosyltransferase involved in cell wall biosynthesis